MGVAITASGCLIGPTISTGRKHYTLVQVYQDPTAQITLLNAQLSGIV